MADELHSGGSLELVQSVSRQLAIVTNHLNDNTQVGSLTNECKSMKLEVSLLQVLYCTILE